jgi:PPOX class probable F420-dependent enzyme
VDRDEARRRVAGARVARLATRTPTGRMDLVPITFAFDGDRLVTAVDHKPKTTTQLKRLDNIRANPEVSLLVDEYDDRDWSSLWWVRLRGLATVVGVGIDTGAGAGAGSGLLVGPAPEAVSAVAALVAKYPQYRDKAPAGDVILIDLVGWQWWSAT